MRILAPLFLLSLIASGLCLPGLFTHAQQQPGTVNVTPRSTASQPGMPEVKATVDRNRVPLGDEVTFTLSPARVVSDSRFRVTLFFGDGRRQIVRQPKLSHLYTQTGTYTYSILVESATSTSTSSQPVLPSVKLTANPMSVDVSQLVNFVAVLSHNYPNLRYRFVFGDGSDSGWQNEANATHVYRAPNTYSAYVDIGVADSGSVKQSGGSTRELIQVRKLLIGPTPDTTSTNRNSNVNSGDRNSNANRQTIGNNNSSPTNTDSGGSNANANSGVNSNVKSSTVTNAKVSAAASPSPSELFTPPTGFSDSTDWWKYVIIAAIILFAAYQARSLIFPPRPTFVPHLDPGDSKVGAGKPLAIDLQMDLDPNLAGGEFKVETQGDSLVKSRRWES
jgi:PKD repeat protein